MKNKILFLAIFLLALGLAADEPSRLEKSFSGIKVLELNLRSGDAVVEEGAAGTVKVRVEYTYPADHYQPKLEQSGDRLVLRDELTRSFFENFSGRCLWTITAPAGTAISCRAASGDVEISGAFVLMELNTASGDVRLEKVAVKGRVNLASGDLTLENISGSFEAGTASGDVHGERLVGDSIRIFSASGDIELSNCRGGFDLKTTSGDIQLQNVEITKPTVAKSLSGDVDVSLAKSATADITLAALSGDVCLDYNGQPLRGSFEFMVKKHSGDVESPVDFAKEEEVLQNGQVYLSKSFSRQGNSPRIVLRVASGTASLEE